MKEKPKINKLTLQDPKPPLKLKFNNSKLPSSYNIDSKSGRHVVFEENEKSKAGQY